MQDSKKVRKDKELVVQVAEGSVEAYELLVERYRTRVYNMALRLTRNPHDAEEVLQDVFVTLYKKASTFEGRCAFSSWLYRITYNTALMLLRKRKNRAADSLDEVEAQGVELPFSKNGTRQDYLKREVAQAIREAVDAMPLHYRQVFMVRDVEGYTNEQAGEILDMSVPAVKSKLHRARQILRKQLRRYWNEFNFETADTRKTYLKAAGSAAA